MTDKIILRYKRRWIAIFLSSLKFALNVSLWITNGIFSCYRVTEYLKNLQFEYRYYRLSEYNKILIMAKLGLVRTITMVFDVHRENTLNFCFAP